MKRIEFHVVQPSTKQGQRNYSRADKSQCKIKGMARLLSYQRRPITYWYYGAQ